MLPALPAGQCRINAALTEQMDLGDVRREIRIPRRTWRFFCLSGWAPRTINITALPFNAILVYLRLI